MSHFGSVGPLHEPASGEWRGRAARCASRDDEADLDILRQLDTDPSTRGPYLPSGFRTPQVRRRRWEEDGWLGDDSAQLAVALTDGTLVGIVSWRTIKTGGPEAGCLEIGALLFPEHRGKGLGTAAQRLLAEYLFATTLANRLQAITDVENIAEQKALERAGFRRRHHVWLGLRPWTLA